MVFLNKHRRTLCLQDFFPGLHDGLEPIMQNQDRFVRFIAFEDCPKRFSAMS